jgi:hypothetical protein
MKFDNAFDHDFNDMKNLQLRNTLWLVERDVCFFISSLFP